jgi:hypothetical protein
MEGLKTEFGLVRGFRHWLECVDGMAGVSTEHAKTSMPDYALHLVGSLLLDYHGCPPSVGGAATTFSCHTPKFIRGPRLFRQALTNYVNNLPGHQVLACSITFDRHPCTCGFLLGCRFEEPLGKFRICEVVLW